MNRPVWVFLHTLHGHPSPGWGGLLQAGIKAAQALNSGLECICWFEPSWEEQVKLADAGVSVIRVIEGANPDVYQNHLCLSTLSKLSRELEPELILFEANHIGRELAPALAAVLNTGCSADCSEVVITEDGQVVLLAPAFAGNLLVEIITPRIRPVVATLKVGGPWPCGKRGEGKIERHPLRSDYPGEWQIQAIEEAVEQQEELEQARIIVAGGAGVAAETWPALKELAQRLNAAVGATRPAVVDGHAEEWQMIGQSGKTVYPDIYLAFGISGDIQHMVGVKNAGLIIAVNRDPRAAVFKYSDIGIVEDANKFIPALLEQLKR